MASSRIHTSNPHYNGTDGGLSGKAGSYLFFSKKERQRMVETGRIHASSPSHPAVASLKKSFKIHRYHFRFFFRIVL